MIGRELVIGEVVQINPSVEMFGGCLMIVSEPKSWGAQGYVQVPGGGQAYLRLVFEDIEPVGMAVWVVGHQDDAPTGGGEAK